MFQKNLGLILLALWAGVLDTSTALEVGFPGGKRSRALDVFEQHGPPVLPQSFILEAAAEDRSMKTSVTGEMVKFAANETHHERGLAFVSTAVAVRVALAVAILAVSVQGFFFRKPPPPVPSLTPKLERGIASYFSPVETSFVLRLEVNNAPVNPKFKVAFEMTKGSRGSVEYDPTQGFASVSMFPDSSGELQFRVIADERLENAAFTMAPKFGQTRIMTSLDTRGSDTYVVPLGRGAIMPQFTGTGTTPGTQTYTSTSEMGHLRVVRAINTNGQNILKQATGFYSLAIRPGQTLQGFVVSLINGASSERKMEEYYNGAVFHLAAMHTGVSNLVVRIYSYGGVFDNDVHTEHGDGVYYVSSDTYHYIRLPTGRSEATVHSATLKITSSGWVRIVLDHDGDDAGLAGVVNFIVDEDSPAWFHSYSELVDNGAIFQVMDNGTEEYWVYLYG